MNKGSFYSQNKSRKKLRHSGRTLVFGRRTFPVLRSTSVFKYTVGLSLSWGRCLFTILLIYCSSYTLLIMLQFIFCWFQVCSDDTQVFYYRKAIWPKLPQTKISHFINDCQESVISEGVNFGRVPRCGRQTDRVKVLYCASLKSCGVIL